MKVLQKMDNTEGSRNRMEGKQAKRVEKKNETRETSKDMGKSFRGKKASLKNLNFYMGGYRKERICILNGTVRESLQ